MANGNFPAGLQPRCYLSGAPYNGAMNTYFIPATDATAVYVGGLVKLAGSADADGIPTVTGNVATGDTVCGVMMGIGRPPAFTGTNYRAASTGTYVLVADDPRLVFEVQEDSVGGALAAADVGMVADLIGFTSGNTFTGLSAIQIDTSTKIAPGDGTADVFIWRLEQTPDNEFGANAKVMVKLNNHAFAGVTAGV
ncbi:hypothetical protein [Haematobacter sp. UBA3484]|uniref:hypothetical protein n=1 Tax=Haematobacter sp. UBA3484 TaxID=1946582 RepID=UPI0025C58A4E|nr:hypothetical protein [Haematobacter sp. UBA3484]